MKYKKDSFTIVIAGKWNQYLLSPQWVGTNLFGVETINVEFPSTFDAPPRFVIDNKIFQATQNYAIGIASNPYDVQNLIDIEKIMDNLVSTLTHTPVLGLGLNFGFVLNDSESRSLRHYFDFSDIIKFNDEGLIINKTTFTREFSIEGNIININFSDKELIEINFNFHFDFISCDQISKYLDGTKFVEKRNLTIDLLKNIYNIEIENNYEN